MGSTHQWTNGPNTHISDHKHTCILGDAKCQNEKFSHSIQFHDLNQQLIDSTGMFYLEAFSSEETLQVIITLLPYLQYNNI